MSRRPGPWPSAGTGVIGDWPLTRPPARDEKEKLGRPGVRRAAPTAAVWARSRRPIRAQRDGAGARPCGGHALAPRRPGALYCNLAGRRCWGRRRACPLGRQGPPAPRRLQSRPSAARGPGPWPWAADRAHRTNRGARCRRTAVGRPPRVRARVACAIRRLREAGWKHCGSACPWRVRPPSPLSRVCVCLRRGRTVVASSRRAQSLVAATSRGADDGCHVTHDGTRTATKMRPLVGGRSSRRTLDGGTHPRRGPTAGPRIAAANTVSCKRDSPGVPTVPAALPAEDPQSGPNNKAVQYLSTVPLYCSVGYCTVRYGTVRCGAVLGRTMLNHASTLCPCVCCCCCCS